MKKRYSNNFAQHLTGLDRPVAGPASEPTSPRAGVTRRAVLSGIGATALLGSLRPALGAEEQSLKARAARHGITFGSAVSAASLKDFPELGAAIARDCAVVVPENEMKWGWTENVRNRPDYKASEVIARFAATSDLRLRGHTAIWYKNIPAWTKAAISGPGGHDLLVKRVHDVVGHFRGRVVEWDVVNESIEPRDGRPDGMRNWPPFAPGDIGLIADCFHAAREADPDALLFYNDYGFEYDSDDEQSRRDAAIRIMEGLKKRNAPIDGFGIQSHLKVGNRFSPDVFRQFLADIAAFNVRISLTELDVNDQRMPSDIEERDDQVADHARQFLDVAFDERAVTTLLTWGFSDASTWLNSAQPRKDNLKQRPLPLDENFAKKPLWHAIAQSLDNAPDRP